MRMDAKWGWLGLLVVVGSFAFIAWRNQTFKPIPSLIVAVQVASRSGSSTTPRVASCMRHDGQTAKERS
jgi:hypothetical protein